MISLRRPVPFFYDYFSLLLNGFSKVTRIFISVSIMNVEVSKIWVSHSVILKRLLPPRFASVLSPVRNTKSLSGMSTRQKTLYKARSCTKFVLRSWPLFSIWTIHMTTTGSRNACKIHTNTAMPTYT